MSGKYMVYFRGTMKPVKCTTVGVGGLTMFVTPDGSTYNMACFAKASNGWYWNARNAMTVSQELHATSSHPKKEPKQEPRRNVKNEPRRNMKQEPRRDVKKEQAELDQLRAELIQQQAKLDQRQAELDQQQTKSDRHMALWLAKLEQQEEKQAQQLAQLQQQQLAQLQQQQLAQLRQQQLAQLQNQRQEEQLHQQREEQQQRDALHHARSYPLVPTTPVVFHRSGRTDGRITMEDVTVIPQLDGTRIRVFQDGTRKLYDQDDDYVCDLPVSGCMIQRRIPATAFHRGIPVGGYTRVGFDPNTYSRT